MSRFLITALILIIGSCNSNYQDKLEIKNFKILEASLLELQNKGLIDENMSFNRRSFQNNEFFSYSKTIPDSIAGLAVVPLEHIFSNNKGIGLKSILRNEETFEVVLWDWSNGAYLVVLNINLKAIKVERLENL